MKGGLWKMRNKLKKYYLAVFSMNRDARLENGYINFRLLPVSDDISFIASYYLGEKIVFKNMAINLYISMAHKVVLLDEDFQYVAESEILYDKKITNNYVPAPETDGFIEDLMKFLSEYVDESSLKKTIFELSLHGTITNKDYFYHHSRNCDDDIKDINNLKDFPTEIYRNSYEN